MRVRRQKNEGEAVANRIAWIALLLLGLAIGFCGGLEQAILGRSIYLVQEAADNKVAPQQEAREGLEKSHTMTTVSMYLGVAAGLVAVIGLSLQGKR